MGTTVVIGDNGLVQSSGATGLVVNGSITAAGGISSGPTVSSMSLGNTNLGSPGFYNIPGAATGTLPLASAQPGAKYYFSHPFGDLTLTGGFLTGSGGNSQGSGTVTIFHQNVSASNVGKTAAQAQPFRFNGLTLERFGSLKVESDGKVWIVTALSGSASGSVLPVFG